jgi:hypothetical protein
VKRISQHIRKATINRCDPALLLILKQSYGSQECVKNRIGSITHRFRHFTPILNDEYIVLRTVTGCDLSLTGLSTGDSVYIEITSDTVPSQQKKGYNTILRAVAVMLAFVEGKPIKADIANSLSAYTLLKDYQASVLTKDDRLVDYRNALSKDEARRVKGECKQVFIRPTVYNLENATRIFWGAVVKCA